MHETGGVHERSEPSIDSPSRGETLIGQRTAGGTIGEVLHLFAEQGDLHFGEVISQRSHALQTALAACAAGADDELVAAALLHDVGHFVSDRSLGSEEDPDTEDDHHEAVGAQWIAQRFDARVARAVALHVIAKRYRCTVDHAYYDQLSDASKESLRIQGGTLDEEAARRFEEHPGFHDALFIRDCDEAGKEDVRDAVTLGAFVDVLQRVART